MAKGIYKAANLKKMFDYTPKTENLRRKCENCEQFKSKGCGEALSFSMTAFKPRPGGSCDRFKIKGKYLFE